MVERVTIDAPFTGKEPECRISGQCRREGVCEKAYAILQEINYELENPGASSLPYQLSTIECEHPQAQEMYRKGIEVLERTRGVTTQEP